MEQRRIVIAGATGFVGRKLACELAARGHDVVGLGRQVGEVSQPNIEWRKADLYSLLEAERGVAGATTAVYLVHSMLPTGRLSQGHFRDYDLILADNFKRACLKAGVTNIVYLGGLVPKLDEHLLSDHLLSRLEVEANFRNSELNSTSLRAGLIVGLEGSSFTILRRLVERLPIMICPSWTQIRCQPVHVDDVVAGLVACIESPRSGHHTFDIGGPDQLSYLQMLQLTAKHLGRRRIFLPISLFSPGLSGLWVSTITGAPRRLVYPLVESLVHPMLVDPERELPLPGRRFIAFEEALERALVSQTIERGRPHAFLRRTMANEFNEVQSVQRLPLPQGKTAEWVARKYLVWLPRFLPMILQVEVRDLTATFRFRFWPRPLLILELSRERSSSERQLFYIRGGLLAGSKNRGRLEFRETGFGQHIIAAIHNYRPTLPWFVYKLSQAKAHLLLMRAFGIYLGRVAKRVARHSKNEHP